MHYGKERVNHAGKEKCEPPQENRITLLSFRKLCLDNEIAKKYVLEKPLIRPNVTVGKVLLNVIIYLAVSIGLTVITRILSPIAGVRAVLLLIIWGLPLFLSKKTIAIKAVECYQHYAKETTRRRCLCMPTCSEYAILVLREYPFMKALRMIRIRLKRTCKGTVYKIDYPDHE